MRHRLATALLAAVCFVLPHAADARSYPAKPIRFIVPFASGGGNDILGRMVALKLHEASGVPVVVDSRGGGGTIVKWAKVVKAENLRAN